jgi:hypothetical protein
LQAVVVLLDEVGVDVGVGVGVGIGVGVGVGATYGETSSSKSIYDVPKEFGKDPITLIK